MAPVIVYTLITEAKQDAVWQKKQCYFSLYISIYHYINSIFNVWVHIHLYTLYTYIYPIPISIYYMYIYTHTYIHRHCIYLYVYRGLLHLPHNHVAMQDKDVTTPHNVQGKHWHWSCPVILVVIDWKQWKCIGSIQAVLSKRPMSMNFCSSWTRRGP